VRHPFRRVRTKFGAIALPADWPKVARSAFLHALGMAHRALTFPLAWAANSPLVHVRLRAEIERLRGEAGLLEGEIAILHARLARLPARTRPHYPADLRLAILALQIQRGWTAAETARHFLITVTTLATWKRRLDDDGPDALVQSTVPINRFSDQVAAFVAALKRAAPAMGKVRIAQMLARAGLHLAPITVLRMLRRNVPAPAPPAPPPLIVAPSGRTVVATRPDHVWGIDITTFDIRHGRVVPWWPFTLPPVWPTCWSIVVVLDYLSRRVIKLRCFRRVPTTEDITRLLDSAGNFPAHLVTDKGGQFQAGYVEWCRLRGVKQRYGALGKHGSIALVERFILSLKNELLRPAVLVPFPIGDMQRLLDAYLVWYNENRQHPGLGGVTPNERALGGVPARKRPRLEPRARYPVPDDGSVKARVAELRLVVTRAEVAKQLVVVELDAA
jgi:transposase InsO family protein